MKKKLTAVALIICMIAIMLVGATMAYFTDETAVKENTFTVGNVKIELTEPKWDASGTKDAPEVYPGEALAKDPTVTNTGKNPCFVRISVKNLDCLGEAGMITYRTNYVAGALGENWVEYNGYYYYTKVLEAGKATPALFDQIVIPADLTNDATENGFEWDSAELSVDVQAFAVQAQGAKPSWSAVQSMTVEEIAAWFATCGMDTAE